MVEIILQYVVPAVLGIGIVGAIVKWVVTVINEVKEALTVITDALADNKVSNEEIQSIIKESKDIVEAVKKIKDIKK